MKRTGTARPWGRGCVAPRAGAWIETGTRYRVRAPTSSPPVRGRGLKLNAELPDRVLFRSSPPVRGRGLKLLQPLYFRLFQCVAPRAGAWIETGPTPISTVIEASPPVRGRGLKRPCTQSRGRCRKSPPVRGRGLKQASRQIRRSQEAMASPPVRGRGLKPRPGHSNPAAFKSRPPCGGVD